MRTIMSERVYNDPDYCLDFISNNTLDMSNISLPVFGRIDYHAYWRGEFGEKQFFSVASWLVTQDLKRARLCLWIDFVDSERVKNNKWLEFLSDYVEIFIYNPSIERVGTPLEKNENVFVVNAHHFRADYFRYMILHKYGGIYFDLDTLFIRDFSQFHGIEFCYQFGTQQYANNAILSLGRNSRVSRHILELCNVDGPPYLANVMRFSRFLEYNEFLLFPFAFFDPKFGNELTSKEDKPKRIIFKEFTDFFYKDLDEGEIAIGGIHERLFRGAFSYHWHNKWDAIPSDKSPYSLIWNELSNKMLQKFGRGFPS